MRFYLRSLAYFCDDLPQIIASLSLIVILIGLRVLQALPLAILIGMFTPDSSRDAWMFRTFHFIVPSNRIGVQIISLAIATIILGIVKEIVQMVQKLLEIRIGYNGLMRVRCDLFRKLQQLSLSYHKSQPQGDAIYRLSSDTFGFQTILNVITGTLVNVFTLAAIIGIMLQSNWRLTLASLVIVPLLLILIKSYAKVLYARSLEAKQVESQMTTTVQRSVASIGLVQAFGREQDEYDRYHSTIRNSVAANMRLHWHEVVFWLYLGIILTLGSAILIGYGGWLISQHQLSLAVFVLFVQYLGQLYDPLNKLTSSGSTLAGGAAGVSRVFEVLDLEPVIRDTPNAIALPIAPRELRFDRVSFSYRADAPVLSDVSFSIAPGQMVAFVGSSGVGKTTLLNLLPRFYDPTSGAIFHGEFDAKNVKIVDLRKHVALVLQESVILPTTVAENISYGKPGATFAQIESVAKLAGASDFIEQLPKKYETEISESGSNLSGGQKQRISIARALLTDAPIIVLDEPTSALDPMNEKMITQTLSNLRGKRTVVIVSHRLSTVVDCDRIFVMDGGRIVEQGTHDELLARRGHYFEMAKHQLQIREEELATDGAPMNTD